MYRYKAFVLQREVTREIALPQVKEIVHDWSTFVWVFHIHCICYVAQWI